MRKGGGAQKGAAFERQVAKLVAKAFRRYGIEQRDCWRSTLSGGHEISCGDLRMSDRLLKLFPWSVECKSRKKILWEHYLIAPNARQPSWQEWKWWEQAVEGAAKREDVFLKPVLVMKENRGPIYALYQLELGAWPRMVTLKRFLSRAVRCVEMGKLKKGA